MPDQTPSQTVGPFFAYALTPEPYGYRGVAGATPADADTPGTPIRISGRVLDGEGSPVPDALLEIWQADHEGVYPDGSGKFRGFGRTETDTEGRFSFHTVKPGSIDAGCAPHINVAVFARGMLSHAFTRIYFSDEDQANSRDPVLASVAEERRATLIALKCDVPAGVAYDFPIRLQGDRETVFFDA